MARRYIRVLTTFNKSNFFISKGRFIGFEYELLKEYEEFLNKKVKKRELKVVLEFIPVSRDRLMSRLLEGYGDIAAAGLTITKRRLVDVDFTDPYISGINEVLVTHKDIAKPKSLAGLSGQRVFVRPSSSYYASLQSYNKSLSRSGKPLIQLVKADENLETEDILELVNSGAIKMTVADSHIALIWSDILKNIRVHKDIRFRSLSKIALMIRKNSPELKASLNRFLKQYRKGTLLGNIYFNRYYKKNPWIKNPLRQEEQNKLKHSSAVGIMQVRPETGKDKNVNVRNVHLLENNIHAGVKYLAFLRERYFNDIAIRPQDRVRFTMAAYNAGPAKIRKARNLAKKMGYDNKKWFRNVEMAALKIIGQETVRYVSKINKYYIIYRLAQER